jgi:hypothetical protein
MPRQNSASLAAEGIRLFSASSVSIIIVNAGVVYLIDLLPFLHLSNLPVITSSSSRVTNGACSRPKRAPIVGLEERLKQA